VVERWIARELSAPAKVKVLVKDAMAAVKGMARLAEGLEAALAPRPARTRPSAAAIWALVLAVLALAASLVALGATLSH
jgi:hypothetical protein